MNVLPTLLLAMLAPAAPQDPNQVLARFQLEGKPATVTRTDVAIEMAFHLRRRDRGQQATNLLVDQALTRRAAKQKKLMPTEAEVQAFWEKLQAELRAAGHKPEDFAAVRNTSTSQWLEDLAVQLAQERLVRSELGLRAEETVSPDMLKLWLQEERRRSKIILDPEQLPSGTCARIDDVDVPIADVGLLLLRTSEDDERDRFVRQVIYLQSLEALARKENTQLTAADLDAAIARRRDDAARDPRYRGVSFEQLLEAEGMTVASLRQLRVFRGQALLDRLAERLFPHDALAAELERDRQNVLDLVGPRRHLGVIFVRALDEPNGLVPLDFPAAAKKLEEVRKRLVAEAFDHVARIESEHVSTKMQGGDAGWHRRRSTQLPDQVLATAFGLAAGEVSTPVRTEDGCWLVKVAEIDPVPDDERLLEQLRRLRAQELAQRLLRDAAIEIVAPESAR